MKTKNRIHLTPNSCQFCISWDEIKRTSFITHYGRYGNCHFCDMVKSAMDTCHGFDRWCNRGER